MIGTAVINTHTVGANGSAGAHSVSGGAERRGGQAVPKTAGREEH